LLLPYKEYAWMEPDWIVRNYGCLDGVESNTYMDEMKGRAQQIGAGLGA